MMSILTLGVLNRVMIKELVLPATLVTLTIAMHQFVSPVRVWFGQMSDARPIRGYHRTGYVWLGATAFCLTSFSIVQVIWQLGESFNLHGWSLGTQLWLGLLGLMFACYGIFVSASSTPFAALLVDVSEEENRGQLVAIVWSMLTVGIVLGAIISGVLLGELELDTPLDLLRSSINQLFLVVLTIVLGLAVVGTAGIEGKYSRYSIRANLRSDQEPITLGRALKILTANSQTWIFFVFLIAMTISLFIQEPVLEPYGGEVFGMAIGETTRLNAYWGMGTLAGLSLTGFLIVPRIGKIATTRYGCMGVAASFALLLFAGFTGQPLLFKIELFIFGIAAGVTTTGALSLMLDLTAAETAGTFIGAWGLAQAIARGSATVLGGAVLDLGRQLFDTPMMAYGTVFCLPIIGMTLAVWLLRRVDVSQFKEQSQQAIAQVLAEDLDT
ncbi:BCD family MFS transporter [Candidatus Synechococcus calcipolaris G9]|uniref:BCD family MFS transporter n=1 Tax=Candidatus Synechococcus calcipolaris G9 TaxID=1497997 RepID=A0ABT6F3P7_9SYNE|nr:BCD family MFS transporter [Candidatus Synechococcus calcipolaris]MDG2992447.1 BCD family MFS transporter [Candidatus Synechococcus calcipolaris G9]